MKIANMKIGVRLGVGFGAVLVLMTVISVLSFSRLEMTNGAIDLIVNDRYPKVVIIKAIEDNNNVMARSSRNLLIMNDQNDIKAEIEKIFEARKDSRKQLESLAQMLTLPKGKELYANIEEARKPYVTAMDRLLKPFIEGRIAYEGLDGVREILLNEVRPAQQEYMASLGTLAAFQAELMDRGGKEADAAVQAAKVLIVTISVIAAVLGAVIAWLITRSITTPVNQAVRIAQTVAAGDLTSRIEVTTKDEMGQLLSALKEMNEGLVRIVGQVRTGTQTIATASGQISAGNMDLSSRTEEQASSLEETASSMEELTTTVKQNADNARQANQMSLAASDVASKGGKVVSQVVSTMQDINESSKKIVDIISVIDGIAFQTNILALNAAVEAARAGEQGRGFAVVATEVRSLAQRSASAAKEIKELIGNSVEKVEAGSKLVTEAGSTMEEVVGSVKRVTDIMSEITAASQEQSAGIEQVNQAITQMDEVTQQNAALVEEAAAASQSLQDQAKLLSELVSTFKLDARVSLEPVLTQAAPALAVTSNHSVTKPSQRPVIAHSKDGKESEMKRLPANGEEWEEF